MNNNKKKSASPLPSKKVLRIKAQLSFFEAMREVAIIGNKIRRIEWADPEEYCLLKDNFLMIHRNDKFHTWIISEGDLLAIDWVIMK